MIPAPFIVGAPRSGTTLLRLMLDAHPDLAIPPETGFLMAVDRWQHAADGRAAFADVITHFPDDAPAWADFGLDADALRAALLELEPFDTGQALRAFYRLYAARFGKARWGDKTPTYCFHVQSILETLPEARIVHLVRDGRDVACSMRGRWFARGHGIEGLATDWGDCIAAARRGAGGTARYLEVRFEALVVETERVLREVCGFLDLPYAPAMLEYHERAPGRLAEHRERRRPDGTLVVSHEGRLSQQALTRHPPQSSRIGAWRDTLTGDEQAAFARVAGGLLAELGYR